MRITNSQVQVNGKRALLAVALGGILLSGCGGQSQSASQQSQSASQQSQNPSQQSQTGTASTIDLAPFKSVARSSDCANIENRLFVIDGATVVWDRKGSCADSSYAVTLYGGTVDTVNCELHDSIAGPVQACPVSGYLDVFNTVSTHLNQPDLGLGQGHNVQEVAF